MDEQDLSEPTVRLDAPEPVASNSRTLTWLVVGMGGVVVLLTCVLVGALVALPTIRERALAMVGVRGAMPPPESPHEASQPAPTHPVVIDDDFDQQSARWDQSGARVVDGAYELRTDIPHFDSYGLYLGPSDQPDFNAGAIDDFDMAVDVQQVSGDPISEYGIRFRQTGPSDYLMFSISGNGYYRLVRVKDDQYTSIVPWTFDRRINTGKDASNRLRVVTQNADITGYINDVEVLKAKDDVDVGGQLTLGTVTYDTGNLAVRFSNIAGKAGSADLKQDFKDPTTAHWSVGDSRIVDGAYEIATGAGVQSWQQPLPTGSSRVDNFTLEVDAALAEGDDTAAYGVLFGDTGNFEYYTLLIFPQGGLGLFHHAGGQTQSLVPPTQLDTVKSGLNAVNTLRLDVAGTAIKVSLNGQVLGTVKSDQPVSGMVGMTVIGGQEGATRARFERFSLKENP